MRETEPFGVTDQPAFLNQVLEVRWGGSPRRLLEAAKAAEVEVGRQASFRWGPREIDVDLLLFGQDVVDEPGLRVPHPGIAERRFVLEPLAELAPDLEVPGTGQTVRQMLDSILGE